MRRYAAELERSNRELQDFAYVSTHDLQEPLRKIQAFGDRLLSKEYENLSEQGQDYINRMLNAASRMQNLINDLLSFSRVTSKSKPFVKVRLDYILSEVLSDLEVAIRSLRKKKIERFCRPFALLCHLFYQKFEVFCVFLEEPLYKKYFESVL